MASEIAFETLRLALESAYGSAAAAPTHHLGVMGLLKPEHAYYEAEDMTGTLERVHRSDRMKEWASFDGEGDLDTHILPVFANMIVTANESPTEVQAGTVYLWEFVPTMTSDVRKSATFWWDAEVQCFQGAYGLLQELKITAESGSDAASKLSASGITQFPSKVSSPAATTLDYGALINGMHLNVWLDTSSAFGTTAVNGRVTNVEHTIPGEVQEKFRPTGAGGAITYTAHGVKKRSATTTITIELLDTAQYDLFADDELVKLRVRHNGPLIAGSDYHFVEFDIYGRMKLTDFSTLGDANRTVQFEIVSQYESTLTAGWRLAIQNDRASL